MSNLTPPPEHDLDPRRRQAIRAALQDAQPGRSRVPIIAAAAVVAVLAAGLAIPQLRTDKSIGPAGGPDPSTPTVSKPVPRTGTTTAPRTLRDGMTPAPGVAHRKTMPIPDATKNPPKDPVQICRESIAETVSHGSGLRPGKNARVVARLDNRWSTTMIIADDKVWVGCDTGFYTFSFNAEGSMLEPTRITAPSARDIDAFAVSGLLLHDPSGPASDSQNVGKGHEHYWAAGVLPEGVTRISYRFPDGVTKDAAIQGRFWLVEHLEAKPYVEGTNVNTRDRIEVNLYRANGTKFRTFTLQHGKHTCAHRNHGC